MDFALSPEFTAFFPVPNGFDLFTRQSANAWQKSGGKLQRGKELHIEFHNAIVQKCASLTRVSLTLVF